MNEKLDYIMLIRGFRRLVEVEPESPPRGFWSTLPSTVERRTTRDFGTKRSHREQG